MVEKEECWYCGMPMKKERWDVITMESEECSVLTLSGEEACCSKTCAEKWKKENIIVKQIR